VWNAKSRKNGMWNAKSRKNGVWNAKSRKNGVWNAKSRKNGVECKILEEWCVECKSGGEPKCLKAKHIYVIQVCYTFLFSEAFKKARQRMMQARENAEKELVKTTGRSVESNA
jgi:hypothetical protein